MKIALFPDDYLPKSTLVHAKMFHELALELKKLGYEPVIITPSHGKQATRLVKETFGGVEVWRFRNPAMRGRGKLQRVISESLLSFNAYLALKSDESIKSFDACINYSPTIFFGPLMHWFKRYCGTYNYLVLRDMFPQWVIDEGLISVKSPIASYFRFFEKVNYNASDTIGLMSPANVTYFSKLHPNYRNLQVLRNWADVSSKSYSTSLIDVRKHCKLDDKVIYFYGGNIGRAQDMGNLLRLVESMQSHPEAHFLFIGQGDEFELVESAKVKKGLDNLTLLSSISQDEYKEVLTQVDVGLFSLAKTHKAHNFPGKLLGYMVQSLPILGSVNQGNDVIEFINGEGAGKAYINGEDQSLYEAALMLLQDQASRKAMGAKAYEVLKTSFSVEAAASQIIDTIEKANQ
ncbi:MULTISPECIES: glycosyltransferase family 4 protein [Vibrio]|uniref:glycosyltransferase family 4 protein n=1 Tax=Vibrio TaxID=662 RepID=UPI0021C39F56|nr:MULTISPECIES: glycosyltransferase family 4 protein [Vibrio]MDE1319341.1 glycosyltransferase family 4 protein [Vibrio aestuarianus]MDF9399667.1 glycosyltransferase WbuB [Vibrio sp. 1180_3]CAH8241969.1 Glycosyltransferase WbuB [Vibrio aestuarianus]